MPTSPKPKRERRSGLLQAVCGICSRRPSKGLELAELQKGLAAESCMVRVSTGLWYVTRRAVLQGQLLFLCLEKGERGVRDFSGLVDPSTVEEALFLQDAEVSCQGRRCTVTLRWEGYAKCLAFADQEAAECWGSRLSAARDRVDLEGILHLAQMVPPAREEPGSRAESPKTKQPQVESVLLDRKVPLAFVNWRDPQAARAEGLALEACPTVDLVPHAVRSTRGLRDPAGRLAVLTAPRSPQAWRSMQRALQQLTTDSEVPI